MTKAVYVIRQSQGTDDSVSLELQRDRVRELAESLADDTTKIDLGNHTGFSSLTKDLDEERIDAHPEMQQLEDDLEAGEYDYLVAWDDTRIARDGYYSTLERKAKLGGCELAFIEDVPEDDLAHSVTRTVETEVKKKEIAKGKEAWQEWSEGADHVGAPPKGLQYASDGRGLEPDPMFSDVMQVFDMLDDGETYEEITAETGVSGPTVSRIKDRGRSYYEQYQQEDSA